MIQVYYDALNNGLKNRFNTIVDYSYDSCDCDDSDCGCRNADYSDYCRSSRYTGLRVDEIDIESIKCYFLSSREPKTLWKTVLIESYPTLYKSSKSLNYCSDDTFLSYCVDRLLRIYKTYDKDNWEITTRRGYYGDEIDNIFLDTEIFNKIIKDIIVLCKIDQSKRIEYVLEKEYGFILDELKDKKFELKKVPFNLLRANSIYSKKINPVDKYKFSEDDAIGIYIDRGGYYSLIDGNHRFCELTNQKHKKSVNIICVTATL